VTIPFLTNFADIALLMMRFMVGFIFFTSGWKHLSDPEHRSAAIEMSKGFTVCLGIVECAGALGVTFGVLTQFAAIGLILIMLGAIQKKILEWHTGFWGKHGTDGWWRADDLRVTHNFRYAQGRKGDSSHDVRSDANLVERQ